jgi:hypothetical protein
VEDRAVAALVRAAEALERVAAANERLNDLAASESISEPPEVMFDPPACPHCGVLDPATQTGGGEGRLSEFVLATPCGSCGKPIFALPLGWRIVGSKEQARELLASGDPQLRGEE